MEHKIPFVVEWIPQMSRVVLLKPGHFIESPSFATKYKSTAYKWKMIFYPNGYKLCSEIADLKPVDLSDFQMMSEEEIADLNSADVSDDRMMSEDDDDEEASARAIITSPKSAIFIVLVPFSTGSAKHGRVKAKVEFGISVRDGCAPIFGKIEDTLFRMQKIDAIKNGGDPSKILKGVSEFSPLCKEVFRQFTPISDERMAITCRLHIDTTDFSRWIGRQRPISLGGSRGRYIINQKLKACKVSVDAKNENLEEAAGSIETISFDSVSIENFDEMIGKIKDQPDLTIISSDGRTFRCHYRKLATSSDIFGRLFDPNSSLFESSTQSVTLPDITGEIWSFLLYFIYFGKLSAEAENSFTEILKVAEKYMVKNLVEICQSSMDVKLDSTNVFDYLKASVNHNLFDLQEACLDFIYCNHDTLFGENGHNVYVQEKLFGGDENIGMILLSLLADRAAQSAGVISFH